MTLWLRDRSPTRPRPGAPALGLVSLLLGALVLPVAGRAAAQDGATPLEHQVKAAFLFNFARFVEWPPDAGRQANDEFVICVADDEAFAAAVDRVVGGKSLDGRVLRVRRLHVGDDIRSCKIVYLGSTDPARLDSLLKSARTTAVLTIGDAPGFTRRGGIINFILQDNRVRFEINPDAAERAGLRISSKLLQLATIVRDARKADSER